LARGLTSALLILLGCAAAPATAWCNLPFREVARQVDLVVLAEFRKPRGEPAEVLVVEVMRGESPRGPLQLDPDALDMFHPRDGNQFLLALNARLQLVQYLDRLGVCRPVNAVPLHKGRLSGRDRFEYYDNGDESMTLDELRADLTGRPGAP